MSLSTAALARPRFTLLTMLALVLVGLWLALDFPSTEEPPVTIRTATVLSMAPGANVERMEQLIARPTEESILGLPEVKRVKTMCALALPSPMLSWMPPCRLPACTRCGNACAPA